MNYIKTFLREYLFVVALTILFYFLYNYTPYRNMVLLTYVLLFFVFYKQKDNERKIRKNMLEEKCNIDLYMELTKKRQETAKTLNNKHTFEYMNINFATANYEKGNYQEALHILEKVDGRYVQKLAAIVYKYELSNCYYKLNKLNQANNLRKEILEDRRLDKKFTYKKICTKIEIDKAIDEGKFDEAKAKIKSAIEIGTNRDICHYYERLFYIALKENNIDEAKKNINKAEITALNLYCIKEMSQKLEDLGVAR